ncbi:hypothetical protein [Actinoplanes sp. NPDC049118]|uniref:hypothetical protein n=1 Tax=Actinoplanes sp. NPDC049118 TaxID=3155769 RepID=UPI0033DA64D6
MWNLQMAVMEPGDSTVWLGVSFFAIVAVGSGALLRARYHRLQAWGPVVDDAIELWTRSWYCRRCGTVSVFGHSGSATVGVDRLASSLISLALRWRMQGSGAKTPSAAVVR